MFKRSEDSKLTSWYFEIDRRLLGMVLVFIVIGIVYAVSAGSVAAVRIGQPWYFFIKKGLWFYILGLGTLFFASMLNKRWVLGLSVLNVVVGIALLLVTVVSPHIVKGSARFVHLFGINIMPADIMKPGLVILTAWFLAKMKELYGQNMFFGKEAWKFRPMSWWTYGTLFLVVLGIVLLHPDLGTAALYLAVLAMMLLVAGLPWKIIGVMAGFAVGMLVFAIASFGHVRRRFAAFFLGEGDQFQVNASVQSIKHGGLFGSANDAFIKEGLPDAHTDFIFATIAEDLGAIVACVMLALILYQINRLITDARLARDRFVMYATGGTAVLFATQVCINLATTLHLIPPKGMTLPFISYGGSSLVSFCLLFGMILAIVREDKWK